MSKLRDHIADVLAHHPTFNLKDDGYSAEDVLRMADSLIRELGLRREDRDGAIMRDGFGQPIRVVMSKHRYVTEWTADE